MSDCPRPLDPIDIEALASGSPPVLAGDAARHAAECRSCAEAIRKAGRLEEALCVAAAAPRAPIDLADRVLRLRPFSRAERRSLAVWRAPLLLLTGLGVAGVSLLAGPLAGPGEQMGLAAAFLAALVAVARASLGWIVELARTAPGGLESLREVLRPTSAGWLALALLAPAGFALRRVLARAVSRR